jgi:hypothetical protein
MPGRQSLHASAVIGIVVALLAASAVLVAVRERVYQPAEIVDESLYLRSGNAARRLAVAYQALVADVYWIRVVQYYGGTKRRLGSGQNAAAGAATGSPEAPTPPRQYTLLYPLLDLTTSLDPRFNIAYRFGAILLAEPPPGGPGRPDLAIALLLKGLRERPDKWQYMQDIGFVHYWWEHDFKTAADWFARASLVPGAPWWLESLAATTTLRGGDRESSRRMWEAIRESAEIDWLRRDAERRLEQLRALDQIDALQRVVDRFAAEAGGPPDDWTALVRARALPGIPVDPTGTQYGLVAGRVGLSASSTLAPLPDAPSVAVHR